MQRLKKLTRRTFNKLCTQTLLLSSFVLNGCSTRKKDTDFEQDDLCEGKTTSAKFDYIIVGSGAGGGPLAVNLARKGHKVLLLEAGGADEDFNYKVPVFHTLSTEDKSMRWDYFVKHYQDSEQAKKDPKFEAQHNGIYYPRAGTLGGCTAHNAMIMVYPHNSDWNHMARHTGDASWNAENMRKYFQRVERNQYVKPTASNPSRHGFKGWLSVNIPNKDVISSVVKDPELRKLIIKSIIEDIKDRNVSLLELAKGVLTDGIIGKIDPNDWRWVKRSGVGFCLTPLATFNGRRNSTREYLNTVASICSDNLEIRTHALAIRVLLDETNRAIGVEYLAGKKLYRADRDLSSIGGPGSKQEVLAKREVILCGGAFNTPQLLKLSGIGPAKELQQHGINVKVNLPGVGENLQDRYEVGIVTEMQEDFSALQGASFKAPQPGEEPEPLFREWQQGQGLYTTNGAVASFIRRSAPERPEPDLYVFGLAGYFKGYYLGYSEKVTQAQNYMTWAILKAHTQNNAGYVRLKSADPQDTPDINFRYFNEGNDATGTDLESVVNGVKFVRAINQRASQYIKAEVVPGAEVKTDVEIAEFIKDNAWGHHASCSCQMGPASDPMAVVDSRFKVHGTQNLRIVDASIFHKIPGFFIVSAIYMISEKASDVIHDDATQKTT